MQFAGHDGAVEAGERQIPAGDIQLVLRQPEEVFPVRPGRVVAQCVIMGYPPRVSVDVDRRPADVVTA